MGARQQGHVAEDDRVVDEDTTRHTCGWRETRSTYRAAISEKSPWGMVNEWWVKLSWGPGREWRWGGYGVLECVGGNLEHNVGHREGPEMRGVCETFGDRARA